VEDVRELWDTLTGAELISAIAEGRVPPPNDVAEYIGQKIVKAEPGRVELSWTPGRHLCNASGIVHGGFIAAILDNGVCLAASSLGELFIPQLTLNLNIDYLRAVHADRTYSVIATTVHAGKTRCVSSATVLDLDGNPCAVANASTTGNLAFARNRKVSTGA
jgi:uncharacterized protein (TIGR00369 family)